MKPKPHPIDVAVGVRLKLLRRAAGLSQDTLAAKLGVTSQQLHKYETGANRISASRMQEIARLLDVPVSKLFESGRSLSTSEGDVDIKDPVIEFVLTTEGKNLNQAYWKLRPNIRLQIRHLCEAFADSQSGAE